MIGRTNTGGGGKIKNTNAILTATVPTGSTVTMAKDGVTLTPTVWVQAADNTHDCALFVISPSLFDVQTPWTVIATLGIDTVSDTVTISTNEQYDVFLTFNLYFIRNGQILVPKAAYSGGHYEASIEQIDGAIKLGYRGDMASCGVVWQITESLLNERIYPKLVARIRSWDNCSNNENSQISICTSNYGGSRIIYTNAYGATFPGDLIVDCSLVDLKNKYACVKIAPSGIVRIEDFYLAR